MSKSEKQPLTVIQLQDCEVTLLGTAHVSRQSTETVERMLRCGNYDAVAVELCESRYRMIQNPDELEKMDLFRVIREGKTSMVIANLALGAYQQKMADELGIEPGAEMRVAITVADDIDIPVVLVDREIGITLKRIYRNIPWWRRFTLAAGLLGTALSNEKVSEEDIEKLKEGDILESALGSLKNNDKSLFKPLINERDQFMSAKIQQVVTGNDYKHLLVVIGAGHLSGMQKILEGNPQPVVQETVDTLARLETLPAENRWFKFIPWLIVFLILGGFATGFQKSPEMGWQMVVDWVLINGSLSALGALIALAHPLTVITAFLAAPLTSLNPTIGAGMVTGAMEAWLRKPTVQDFQYLKTDVTHLKGWWNNRVARVLLVFLLSSLGSGFGTYLAGFMIFQRLAG